MRPPVPSLEGRTTFLTGAASGIGRATALAAAREGAVLFLTDVDQAGLLATVDEIRAAGGAVAYAEAVDLADHDAVRAMAEAITREHGALDVVMNIAGIAMWGTISSLPHSTWRRVVDVNLMGPIHVLEHLVPPMVESGRGGQVVNVSSAAGIIGMPWHAAYSASKFGLRGVSEVLRFDLAPHRIGVSLVCPGGVDTGLAETIDIAGIDATSKAFVRARARFRKRAVSPEQAAEAILRGVRRNRYWVYTSRDIHLLHLVQRYFPPAYVLAMRALNAGANRALPAVARARREDAR
ncbi:MAG TPA: SDR family oxidoreductase [Marmoricola sp.]|nr:SDR family oxidoreductase [Marmoricola sp.]